MKDISVAAPAYVQPLQRGNAMAFNRQPNQPPITKLGNTRLGRARWVPEKMLPGGYVAYCGGYWFMFLRLGLKVSHSE